MADKLMYVTKKQVADYIKRTTIRLEISENELLKEVELALTDLENTKGFNRNQVKFFERVKATLNSQ